MKRIIAKMAPENKSLWNPEKTSTFRWRLIKMGIRIRDVTPVRVNEIAAPSRPKRGTRIKSDTRYCTAAVASKVPDSLAFPIPINKEERVRPNMRRNVPTMRI